jgi:hypothetical protein
MLCKKRTPFDDSFAYIDITPVQKSVLTHRFMPLLSHLRTRTYRVSTFFNTGRIIVTVGSLIVPALLSIQFTGSQQVVVYWATWTVSLCVTICNALLTLFKMDKRYYYLHTCLEQLHSEGWQYIELSGKYSGFNTPNIVPTHANQFIYFSHAVEKIRMRQVEEEYFKLIDMNQPHAPPVPIDSLIPPTPLKEEYKRMLAQMQPIISPIINDQRVEREQASEGPDTEDITHGTPQSMSMQQRVPPAVPEGVGILFNPSRLQGRVST